MFLRRPLVSFSPFPTDCSVRLRGTLLSCWVLFSLTAMTGCQQASYESSASLKIDESATPMAAEEFWKIINELEPSMFQPRERRKALVNVLAEKSLDELKGFKLQYAAQLNRVNRKNVHDVFVAISGFTDPEASMAFRDFLVACGEEACQNVIDDPQAMLEYTNATTIEFDDYEFYLTPDSAIQQSTGDRKAGVAVRLDIQMEPTGEGIDLSDEAMVKEKYPKLMEFIERRNRLDEKELFGG